MKIYATIFNNFEILGICRNQSRINGKTLRTYLIYGVGVTCSTMYLICDANSFQEYTNNLYITSALAVGFYCLTNMFLKKNDLFALADGIEKALDQKCENLTSKVLYEQTNQFVGKLSQIVSFVVASITPLFIIFPMAIISYFKYFATDMGNVAFELPLFYWFPFDWRNPLGYFGAIVIQYMTMVCHFNFAACGVTFAVTNFFFALSFTKDVKSDLKGINESAKTRQNRLETLKQISKFVEFHSTSKQFVDEFLDIYQPKFMIIYMWSLVTICGVMLLVQMAIQGNDSLALILVTAFYGLYAFGIILAMCELGQRLTDAFGEIEDDINEFEWNAFPLEVQKTLPIILLQAQQPVLVLCFGSTSGLRETFTNVINSAFSYFTVIREFVK